MTATLAAEMRSDAGKGIARKLRKAGQIPATMYSRGQAATSLTVDPYALSEIFRKSRNRNTVVELDLDGKKIPVLVKDAQRHPVSRELLHVDFYSVEKGHPVTIDVPVRGVGRSAGAVFGGRLRLIRRTLKARCEYDKIPEAFEVDLTPMNIGDMVKASEVPRPDGVEVLYDHDFNVLTIYGKRVRK